MRRAPAVERRSPAPSRHGHHTLGHRVLPAFPVQEAFASSVPSLGPACGPAAMVGGSTPCTAGDALGAGRLAGRHRQRVTTGAHRCQPVSTADGARVWGKETYTMGFQEHSPSCHAGHDGPPAAITEFFTVRKVPRIMLWTVFAIFFSKNN